MNTDPSRETERLTSLEHIISYGNRTSIMDFIVDVRDNWIVCADGFAVSVIAGIYTHCSPRPGFDAPEEYRGPYTHVEVGFPSQRPEPWTEWREYAEEPKNPTETVYGWVPVDLVRKLIADHGGDS